jgi:hypothetical protein
MQAHGGLRIIWQSAMGVGETRGHLGPLYNWLLIPLLLRHVFADKERQEAIIRATPLDWTIVQPAALTNGPLTETYRVGAHTSFTFELMEKYQKSDPFKFIIYAAEGWRTNPQMSVGK